MAILAAWKDEAFFLTNCFLSVSSAVHFAFLDHTVLLFLFAYYCYILVVILSILSLVTSVGGMWMVNLKYFSVYCLK